MLLSVVSLISSSGGIHLTEIILKVWVINGQKRRRCIYMWSWTEMLTASYRPRARTVWIPLRTSIEICRLGEGHSLCPWECRLTKLKPYVLSQNAKTLSQTQVKILLYITFLRKLYQYMFDVTSTLSRILLARYCRYSWMSGWSILLFRSVGQRSRSKVKPILYMSGKGALVFYKHLYLILS